jgi:hypothetical protein
MPNYYPERYKPNKVKGIGDKGKTVDLQFVDGSDFLFNQQFSIEIEHVPTKKSIQFKAFITAFNDTYSQDWNSQPVFGRADPLYNFKQTTRRISLGFKMPAASESEAYHNLAKAQMLAQFMYPNYTDINGANVLSQGPLLRLKVMNLLQKAGDKNQSENPKSLYDGYNRGGEGILGWFSDVTFNYNLEGTEGVFHKQDYDGTNQAGTILPKIIEVSIGGFNPIHEHLVGWQVTKDSSGNITGMYFGENKSFPYGADIDPTAAPKPTPYTPWESQIQTRPVNSFSETEQERLEREKAEAAIANAEARYGGMFGDARRRKDERKKDKYSESKRAYVNSALAGQAAIEQAEKMNSLTYDSYDDTVYDPVDFVEY